MDWRTSKKLLTLRCTSDLEGEGTASALLRNGGRPFVAGLSTGLSNLVQPASRIQQLDHSFMEIFYQSPPISWRKLA